MAGAASSYIKTTSAAIQRVRDQLAFPYTARPQAHSGYIRFCVLEIPQTAQDRVLVQLGSNAASTPRLYVALNSPTVFQGLYHNGISSVAPTVTHTLTIGDTAEVRWTLSAAGVFQLSHAKNLGAETTGSAASALVLPTVWASQHLMLNSAGTANVNLAGYLNLRLERGTVSLQRFRELERVV